MDNGIPVYFLKDRLHVIFEAEEPVKKGFLNSVIKQQIPSLENGEYLA
jgi:hypothetical protein